MGLFAWFILRFLGLGQGTRRLDELFLKGLLVVELMRFLGSLGVGLSEHNLYDCYNSNTIYFDRSKP